MVVSAEILHIQGPEMSLKCHNHDLQGIVAMNRVPQWVQICQLLPWRSGQ